MPAGWQPTAAESGCWLCKLALGLQSSLDEQRETEAGAVLSGLAAGQGLAEAWSVAPAPSSTLPAPPGAGILPRLADGRARG